jgi:hypothetical protein
MSHRFACSGHGRMSADRLHRLWKSPSFLGLSFLSPMGFGGPSVLASDGTGHSTFLTFGHCSWGDQGCAVRLQAPPGRNAHLHIIPLLWDLSFMKSTFNHLGALTLLECALTDFNPVTPLECALNSLAKKRSRLRRRSQGASITEYQTKVLCHLVRRYRCSYNLRNLFSLWSQHPALTVQLTTGGVEHGVVH